MVKIFALGKVNRQLTEFTTQTQLNEIDKRLLKGFYTRTQQEFEE